MTTTYDIDRDVRIDDAAEILECHNITLFVIGAREDGEKAWDELAAAHGKRIAVAQPQGDQLVVSWHWSDKTIAWRIRQAFRAAGMRATWGGEVWNAVRVDLALTH